MTKIDTSGFVEPPYSGPTCAPVVYWDDLSPFTQGYIEALFASDCGVRSIPALTAFDAARIDRVGFSDLTPEALALIIADCEAWFSGWVKHPNNAAVRKDDRTEGGRFWAYRQTSEMTHFPPLTVQLGDDGKVRFA